MELTRERALGLVRQEFEQRMLTCTWIRKGPEQKKFGLSCRGFDSLELKRRGSEWVWCLLFTLHLSAEVRVAAELDFAELTEAGVREILNTRLPGIAKVRLQEEFSDTRIVEVHWDPAFS